MAFSSVLPHDEVEKAVMKPPAGIVIVTEHRSLEPGKAPDFRITWKIHLKIHHTPLQTPLVTWINSHAVDMPGLATSGLCASCSDDPERVETAQLLWTAGPPALSAHAVCGWEGWQMCQGCLSAHGGFP